MLCGLLLCVIIIGCKQTHCPAFPKAIADTYFPYSENSVLNYSNINGDTLILKIDVYSLTGSHSYKWNCDCDCEAGAAFRTKREITSLMMNGNIILYDNGAFLMIGIHDDVSYDQNFYFTIDEINPYRSENVRLFGDTINLMKEDNQRFTGIQLIAEKGITRFFDKEQDCEWVLVEK